MLKVYERFVKCNSKIRSVWVERQAQIVVHRMCVYVTKVPQIPSVIWSFELSKVCKVLSTTTAGYLYYCSKYSYTKTINNQSLIINYPQTITSRLKNDQCWPVTTACNTFKRSGFEIYLRILISHWRMQYELCIFKTSKTNGRSVIMPLNRHLLI